MDDKLDVDKIDDVMLPGFRFHPTDEELVGFYLKRKIQQRSLPIELIKQVDIYKYDPWDLPKLATTGEKEWYFYCPRDRKYRNSARPNRVTGAGFWKATGTDRPIYSSDGTKCIGLKKSLVFYRGRAAKGLKTDWMMHEFRLPTSPDSAPPKKFLDKSLPLNDSWAICRIFKKTTSMANRALSHPWVTVLSEAPSPEAFITQPAYSANFSSENISSTTETGSAIHNQLCNSDELQQAAPNYSALNNIPTYRSLNGMFLRPPPFSMEPCNFTIPSPQVSSCPTNKSSSLDAASMLFNLTPTLLSEVTTNKTSESLEFEESQHFNNFSMEDDEGGLGNSQTSTNTNDHWGNTRSMVFPFNLATNFSWDSSPPCPPSEISTTYSTTKSYT